MIITGMGVVSPIGHGPDAFWDALMNGKSAAAPVRSFDSSSLARHTGCEITSLPESDRPIDRALVGGGRCTDLAVLAARAALADAGLNGDALRDKRVAVTVGSTMGESECIETVYDDLTDQPVPEGAFANVVRNAPGRLSRAVATEVAPARPRCLDLHGACAAGNMALVKALNLLRFDHADVVLAGGADAFSRFAFVGFMRNRVMAKEHCRPFDKKRDGLLVGEGGCMFLLERANDAIGRQRHAIVRGGGLSCDAYNPTAPHPDARGMIDAVEAAMTDAAMPAETIQYVSAHGTGTPRNDGVEWKAIDHCFPAGTPFSSIKALTGHTMGAAGALEAAACILALREQHLIPNWNFETPTVDGSAQPVREPRATELESVANLSFGFGGYNSCVILGHA